MAATAGYDVTIVEINNQLVEQAQNSIKNSLGRVAKKQFKDDTDKQTQFVTDVSKRVNGSSDLQGVVKGTDLVIEAIVENIGIKHKLFESIDKVNNCVQFPYLFPLFSYFYCYFSTFSAFWTWIKYNNGDEYK